jgi:GAF domain-containing protein
MIDKNLKNVSSPSPVESRPSAPASETLKDSHQRLENRITERTRELSDLYAAMAPLISSDAGQLVQQIVERLKEATGADAALIRILDAEANAFLHPAHVGFSAAFLEATRQLRQGSAIGAAFVSGQPIITTDIARDPRLKGKRQLEEGFRSCAFLPFKVAGKLRGIIHLASREIGHFTEDKTDHLMAIARQMGVALENRELFEESRKRTQEQAALSAVATAVSRSLDVAEILNIAVDKVLEVTGRDRGYIRLKDPVTGEIVLSVHRGISQNYVEKLLQRKIPGPNLDQVFATGEPLVFNDPDKIPLSEETAAEGRRVMASIPLNARGKVVGILNLSSTHLVPFSTREVDLLQAIGNVIGVSVENGRLYKESRQQQEIQKLLKELSQDITVLDLDPLLTKIAGKVRDVFRVDIADFRIIKEGAVKFFGRSGEGSERLIGTGKMMGRMKWILEHGEPLMIPDATRETSIPSGESIRRLGIRGFLAVPLFSRSDEIIGILRILTYQRREFSRSEIELLQQLANGAAIVIENARLFEETERRAQEQATVNAIAIAVSQSLKIEEILTLALDKLLEVTKRERGYVRLKDPVSGEFLLVAYRGVSNGFLEILRRGARAGGISDQVFASGEPVIVNDVDDSPMWAETRREGFRSMAWMPLKTRGKVVGILNLGTDQPISFTIREVELLRTIGNVIGVAVQNAWLYRESRQQQEVQKLLKELSQDITALDINALFQKVTNKVREFFKVDISDIRLLEAGGRRRTVGSSGIESERLYKLGTSRGRSGWMRQNRRALVIPDLTKDTSGIPAGDTTNELGVRGYLAVPLFSRSGEVIGILRALTYQPREFTESEVDLLQQLANGTAIALSNAKLFEKTQRQEEIQKLLKELSQDITTLDIDNLLKKLTGKVREFFTVDVCDVRVVEKGVWRVMGVSGTEAERVQSDSTGTARGRSKWILENRKPLLISDITQETGFSGGESIRRASIRGYIGIPLFSRSGEVIGILRALTYEPRGFAQSEVDLLQQLANGTAIALMNARLFEETEQRAHEQAVLNDIARATSQSLHLDDLLQIALDKVLEVTGREKGYIRLKDPLSGELTLAAHRNVSEEYVETLLHRRTPGGKTDQVFKTGEPLVINDPEGALLKEETRREGSRSIAWIPLKAQGGVVGVLNVSTVRPVSFAAREVELLQAIGNIIGVALENARLFEETEHRASELSALYAVTAAVSASFDLERILLQGLEAVLGVTGMDGGYIQLLEGEPPQLAFKAHSGMSPFIIGKLRHELRPGGKTEQIIATKQPIVLEDIPPDHAGKFSGENITAAAWVPIMSKEKVIGVLTTSSKTKRTFPQDQLPLLVSIGNALGVALENARLFDDAKRLVENLKATTSKLDAKNKELNTFVYTVSHDLKAPLVSLQGMTELILQDYGDKLDGDGHHYLERLKFNVGHMERLVLDLLALSRIGREGRPSEKVPLNEVVEGFLLEHGGEIRSRKIRVERRPLPVLWGIRVQIEQVMSNLLGNAVKYLGETSAPAIEIGAEDEGETLRCYIKDNGIGIAPAYHEKVFEIFQRLKDAEVEGSGVGLTIVKKIVEGAGGRVWVESAKGEGATFYFTWPKQPTECENDLKKDT